MNTYLFVLLQANFKTEINKILSDYGVPIVAFVMLLGLIHGVVSNWAAIYSVEPGRRKEAFINVLYIVGYYALAIVVIGVAVASLSKIKLNV